MTVPLPATPRDQPRPTADRPGLRILPAPDPEAPIEDDPRWDRPALHLVPRGVAPPPADGSAVPPSGPPGARRAAWRLINGYLEVLRGCRPVAQLIDGATRTGAEHLSDVTPQPDRRIRLYRLHVTEPLPGRAEVVVMLTDDDSGEIWALAVQLVHLGGGWRCAHFQMLRTASAAVGDRQRQYQYRRRGSAGPAGVR